MTRCFIAVDIVQGDVLAKISSIQKLLLDTGAELKIVNSQRMHLTLKFLGEIDEYLIQKVMSIIDGIEFTPFEIKLKGLGVFPNLQRMRVIWIGVEKGGRELSEISSRLDSSMRKLGFHGEKRGFSPHLTIARVKSKKRVERISPIISIYEKEDFGRQLIEEVKLKKSVLTPQGPIYSTLYEKKAR